MRLSQCPWGKQDKKIMTKMETRIKTKEVKKGGGKKEYILMMIKELKQGKTKCCIFILAFNSATCGQENEEKIKGEKMEPQALSQG